MLVYDVTDRQSYNALAGWMAEIERVRNGYASGCRGAEFLATMRLRLRLLLLLLLPPPTPLLLPPPTC